MSEEANGTLVETPVSQTPETATTPEVTSAPDTSGAAVSETPSSPSSPAQPNFVSVRDAIRQMDPTYAGSLGGDNDHAVLQQIVLQARQAQQYQQQLAWYQQQHLAAQRAQQQPPAAPAEEKPWWNKFWNPPEYDASWKDLIRRDEQGNLVPVPGAPPDLVGKYQQYNHWRQQQAERLLQNPYTFIEEPVKHLAEQVAMQVVQQHMGGYQERNKAASFVQEHSSWLHERDPQGQVQYDLAPNGQGVPRLSNAGRLFASYVGQLEQAGVRDVDTQQRLAMAQVQRDLLMAQRQAAPAPAQAAAAQQQANQTFLQKTAAQHHPNGGGAAVSASGKRRDLAAMMREDLKSNGVNDADFMATTR